jgi:hypothetical protein
MESCPPLLPAHIPLRCPCLPSVALPRATSPPSQHHIAPQFTEALKDFRTAIFMDGRNPDGYIRRGQVYMALDEVGSGWYMYTYLHCASETQLRNSRYTQPHWTCLCYKTCVLRA